MALVDGLRILGSCMERSINIGPPICEECGRPMLWLGQLPKIGLRPLVYVYKCVTCREIVTVEPTKMSSIRE